MIVNRKQAADVFGVEPNTIARWIRRGMPTIDDGGGRQGRESQIDTAAAIAWLSDERSSESVGEVARARAEYLRSATLERRLSTRTTLTKMVSEDELQSFVTGAWLVFLESWRGIATRFFYGLRHPIGEEAARIVAGSLDAEAVAWLAEGRDHVRTKMRDLLAKVSAPDRVDALLRTLEKETAVPGAPVSTVQTSADRSNGGFNRTESI
jgi:hypothetical protein